MAVLWRRRSVAATVVAAIAATATVCRADGDGTDSGASTSSARSRSRDISDVRDAGATGNGASDDGTSFQKAIDSLSPAGGNVLVPCGAFKIDTGKPLVISSPGTGIKGLGFCSKLLVHGAGDLLHINAPLFRLEDLEIVVSSPANRAGAAIVEIESSGGQGYVRNVRFTGHNGSPNNGIAIRMEKGIGSWVFNDVRVSGGATWTSAFRFATKTLGMSASNFIHNLTGTSVKVTVAGIDVDGAIDTLSIESGGLTVVGAPFLWVRNELHAGTAPRWIHCTNCFAETGGPMSGHAAVQLDAVRDFRYTGYLASSTTGVAVGPAATQVGVYKTEFVNIGKSCITIAKGSSAISIEGNSFEDCANSTNDVHDAVSVAAGAQGWRLVDNDFSSSGAKHPRYNIFIAPGSGDYFQIVGNRFATPGDSGTISDGATGNHRWMMSNWGAPNVFAGGDHDSTEWNTRTAHNAPVSFRKGLTNDSGDLVLESETGFQAVQSLKVAGGITASTSGNTDLAGNLRASNGLATYEFSGKHSVSPVCICSNTSPSGSWCSISGITATSVTFRVPEATNTLSYVCVGRRR